VETPTITKPLLRWAGSKRLSLVSLMPLLPPRFGRYLEPFCGSAALFFRIRPAYSILSDINAQLIEFYHLVTVWAPEIYDLAVSFPRDHSTYYTLRREFNNTTDSVQRAAIFYYLNKNCFNGLFRTSRSGAFNVPFSPHRTGEYIPKVEFLAAANLLRSAQIFCGDFENTITSNCIENDFILLDPPYSEATRYPFREYYPGCFSTNDIHRLMSAIETIENRGAKFLLTFSNCL